MSYSDFCRDELKSASPVRCIAGQQIRVAGEVDWFTVLEVDATADLVIFGDEDCPRSCRRRHVVAVR